MHQLKSMKETLINSVQAQLNNLDKADCQELGAAIDMIKDLSEAVYYCSIVEAMEKKDSREHERYYIEPKYYIPSDYNQRYVDHDMGRMYYDGGSSSTHGSTHMSYSEREYPTVNMRDVREGKSPMSRRSYMESKEMHHDKAKKMKELDKYMHELSQDLIEMIQDASPDEKQLLHSKLATLADKLDD